MLFDTSVSIMQYLLLNFHPIHRKCRKTVYTITTTTIRNLLFSLMVGQIGHLYIFRHQDFSLQHILQINLSLKLSVNVKSGEQREREKREREHERDFKYNTKHILLFYYSLLLRENGVFRLSALRIFMVKNKNGRFITTTNTYPDIEYS